MANANYEPIFEFLEPKYRHNSDPADVGDERIVLPDNKCLHTVVAVMRANPPHVNHTAMLRELCRKSVLAKINLGSSNKFNEKNPFRIEEREAMMRLSLDGHASNYELKRLPDFGDDQGWFDHLSGQNSPFTEIISNNEYDLKIYSRYQFEEGHEGDDRYLKYDVLMPDDVLRHDKMLYISGITKKNGEYVPARKPMYVSGTLVRAAIVNDWKLDGLLDAPVAEYIMREGINARLKQYCANLEGISLSKLEENR